jgi:hypothetical protein
VLRQDSNFSDREENHQRFSRYARAAIPPAAEKNHQIFLKR